VPQVLTPPAGSVIQLAWLIPLIPAVSAGLLLLFGKRLGRIAAPVAIAAIGASFVLSLLMFGALRAQPPDARTFVVHVADWLQIGSLTVAWDLRIDPLSADPYATGVFVMPTFDVPEEPVIPLLPDLLGLQPKSSL